MTERDPVDDLAEALFDAARQERVSESTRARAKLLTHSANRGIHAAGARGEQPARVPARLPAVGTALGLAAAAFLLAFAWTSALHRDAREPSITSLTPETLEAAAPARAAKRAAAPSSTPARAQQKPAPDATERPRDAARATGKPAPRPAATLAQEIALLDEARAALSAKDGARVLALVDQYEHTLSGTRMRAEAALLRIEALAQDGRRAEAAQLAQRFVQDHAGNPLAERARVLSKIEDVAAEGDRE